MFDTQIHTVLIDRPDDTSGLRALVDSGSVDPRAIVCIMISHAGGEEARRLASDAFADLLAERLDSSSETVLRTIPIMAIAGLTGYMTAHAAIVVRTDAPSASPGGAKRLIAAGACTRTLLPEEVGTRTHIEVVRDTVRQLIVDAHIEDPRDVHLVFVKGQWPAAAARDDASSRGKRLVAEDDQQVGRYSRGASALGAAFALDEIDSADLDTIEILGEPGRHYSTITHCSSGGERLNNAIVLLGNSTSSVSDCVIGHGMLEDGIDAAGVRAVLKSVGFNFDALPAERDLERVVYAFLKPKGDVPTLKGYLHTMKTDPTLGPFAWIIEKAPVHAVASSVLGTPLIETATGPEHQGLPGHPLLSVVARVG